jgi:two-component system, response regulator / RNA-binding antiterminator
MLRVMLVDEKPDRLGLLSEKLAADGCIVVACVRPKDDLLSAVDRHRPDVVIIDMDSPSRDTLESLRSVQASAPRPMLLFTQDDQEKTIREAVEAGVTAYIVDGLEARRVRPILDTALARFRQYRALEQELEAMRSQLRERKLVDRAKGILMEQRQLREAEAYRLLRKAAMDRNKRLVDIAETIVTAHEVLGGA